MVVTMVSKKGGRRVNEDAAGRAKKKGIVCVVLADGLGGHYGGSIASGIAVETVLAAFNERPVFSEQAIREYISLASDAIMERADADEQYGHMSSTIAVLLIKGKKAVWGNVGDTRLYRFHHNRIEEVTEDHSLAFLSFMNGEIEYDDIRTSSDQNKLTSALGIASGEMNVSKVIDIDNYTSFLICTDGWWEYVSDEDMEESLKESHTGKEWIAKMLELHDGAAPEGCDNYSAAAVVI
ncbi:MAG: protein phosphatase 2C domain-containing protein [Clostridiales bacterium]|nr:protein phosphatase 2C domain-containing protein [Clostridiales bacterium]